MEDQFNEESSFFSIPTPYTYEVYEVQKTHFLKEKTKHFSIIQKEQLICKLHSHILEEEFDLTFMLFETNHLSIPEEFNPDFVEILVKYFYFKEILPIAFKDIFQFFQLAFYLKVGSLAKGIMEFLKGNLNDIKKATIIYKGAIEFVYFFKEDGRKFINPLLENCFVFFIKNNYFNDFSQIFDEFFFETLKENLEEMFFSLLKTMKACKTPNEIMIQFVELFQEPLAIAKKKIDINFNSQSFFRKILQENLFLADINLNETDEVLKKLTLKNNDENIDFMVNVFSKKIVKLEVENHVLKSELETSREKEKGFDEKIKKMEEKFSKIEQKVQKMNKTMKGSEEEINKLKKKNNEKKKKLIEKDCENEQMNKNMTKSEEMNFGTKKYQIKVEQLKKKTLRTYRFCDENDDGHFSLSNRNKTLEKTSGGEGWRGFRCNILNPKGSNQLKFSIKIENTADANIMIGFCVKSANSSCGYFKTNSSCFMLSLSNGNFYHRSSSSPYIHSHIAKENNIYTSKLDVKQKSIEFFLNGTSLGIPRKINFKKEEIPLLCPCVDLYDQDDKVSVV